MLTESVEIDSGLANYPFVEVADRDNPDAFLGKQPGCNRPDIAVSLHGRSRSIGRHRKMLQRARNDNCNTSPVASRRLSKTGSPVTWHPVVLAMPRDQLIASLIWPMSVSPPPYRVRECKRTGRSSKQRFSCSYE